MPRTRNRNEKRDFEVYLILSSCSNEFYVGKIKKGLSYQAYKDHLRLRNRQTKNLFAHSMKRGILPKMYLLETINTTKTESYSHCVVWTRYFLDHGYQPIATKKTIEYANDLTEENEKMYAQIKVIPVCEIINEKKLLVLNYTPRQSEPQKNIISVCVNSNEYDYIYQQAQSLGLSMSKYCKTMIIDGQIIEIDLSEHLKEIRDIKQTLYEVELAILQNGKYYPADVENLEKLAAAVHKSNLELTKSITNQLKKLRKERKLKLELLRKQESKMP